MKKILYCMHVGWNWIKQRPHYIAEELSNEYDVTVISDYNYRVKKVKPEETDTLHVKNFYKIPRIDNCRYLYRMNVLLRRLYYSYYIKRIKPDYLYVMTPKIVDCIPAWYDGKIIYDCMDDMLEFTNDKIKQRQIANDESRLIERTCITLVSSNNLKRQLLKRYPQIKSSKYLLIRNGYGDVIDLPHIRYQGNKNKFIICYFGTIAYWFNFDYIVKSLKDISNLEYLLIGPLQAGTTVPDNDRIHYIGPVEHDKLSQYIKDADAFMMPFILNPLIESVDPVKLYEYINFNKNILCVRYSEIERFNDFVYFYDDYKSFVSQIKVIMNDTSPKYDERQRKEFLSENTWKRRANSISKVLGAMD